MRRADFFRGYAIPFRIEPRLGQVPENGSEVTVPPEKPRDIFEEDHRRLDLSYNANGVRPHVLWVESSELLTGDAEAGTWETGSDDIHAATVGQSVERSHIGEDGGIVEASVSDSRSEDSLAVFVPFDIADRSPPQ